ncbi:FadR/GntR family transcriptional regulator [Brachybacterium sacelli]|uniref:GntR family transcriptional repressor for pyruvate dehydrogenase complex n=1 Tax=Brachybacterium sacelli TaxID=173364 RepID=A0ABS4X6U1_9MICO|nr:FadR/GntR family transcriptional regulator [Brachybacterium sacelli]MBP2384164.1 GntR family transcriptional repressor for pyruvate dehydrogenase complex [Brachybacterium sacelli]
MTAHRTADLVAALRRRIVDGEIAPGEKLPSENQLIAAHGVSRTVVREAVTRLQAEGLVRTRRGAGSFALTPPAEQGSGWPARPVRTVAERRALLELRTGLESEAASLAAVRRTAADLAAMGDALARFEDSAGAPAAALEHDFAFHRAVAEAAGNPLLLELIDALGPAMIAMPRHRLDPAGADGAGGGRGSGAVGHEHAAVLTAITAGDAQAAAAAMRTHLAGSRRRLDGK